VIAYALAADHPDRLDRLAVAEAPLPGVAPSPPLWGLPLLPTSRLYHLMFNQLAMLNEQLVQGREDIFFGFEFDIFAAKKLPDYAVRYYIDTLRRPDALHASFELYRAFHTTVAQNKQRAAQRLTLPVLAIGGMANLGDQVGNAMMMAADDVQSVVIPGCGHWVAEEAPEETLAALTAFLAK